MKTPWRLILNPLHWPSWLLVGFGWLLVQLPHRAQMRVGCWLGDLGGWLVPSRRHVADINIRLCFPHLNEQERRNMVRDTLRSAGMGVLETMNAWWASDAHIVSISEYVGLENLEKAKASGKGVIVLSAHFSSLEIGVRIMSLKASVSAMYKPVVNPVFDWVQKRGREQKARCAMIGHHDTRGFLKLLSRGTYIWYSPDQYPRNKKVRALVPFFGVPAQTYITTGRFAKIADALVLPAYVTRKRDLSGYTLSIHPPLDHFPGGSDLDDALRINQLIERVVREYPEQYFWVHRRFKNAAEKDPYT